jgi:acylphosphatase
VLVLIVSPDRTAKTISLRIHGRVQGVFYRAWTVAEASRRGLRGWVRNRSDGTVEAVASGPAAKVDELIAACRIGPPRAAVSRVEVAEADESQAALFGPGFTQAPSV